MPDFFKLAGRRYTPVPIPKNFINSKQCDKRETYFQPHLLLKLGNIIMPSRFESGLNYSLFPLEQSILLKREKLDSVFSVIY